MYVSLSVLAFLAFFVFVLLVAITISHLLLRRYKEKQSIYTQFPGHVDEFFLVMSAEGVLLDAAPRLFSDPFFEKICQEKRFETILSASEYARLQEYLKGVEAYPNIPFIFAFRSEADTRWYELRAHVQKKVGEKNLLLLLKNVTMDVDSRNQRDRLQENVDMLLQNTGDFLWSFDVDSRQLTLLTPISDDEGRVVPRSVGVQNIHSLLLDEEYAMFEKRINARIVAFRATNQDSEENASIKMRLIGPEGKLVWYNFRCRLHMEENSKIVIRGSARRMDLLFDNPVFEESEDVDAAIATMLSFPDIRIFCVDRENKVVSCNQAFALDFRFTSPRGTFGKRLLEVVRPKYYSFIQGILSEVFESGRAKSWKGPFNRDRRLLWFNAIPLKRSDGFTYRVLGVYIQMDEDSFRDS